MYLHDDSLLSLTQWSSFMTPVVSAVICRRERETTILLLPHWTFCGVYELWPMRCDAMSNRRDGSGTCRCHAGKIVSVVMENGMIRVNGGALCLWHHTVPVLIDLRGVWLESVDLLSLYCWCTHSGGNMFCLLISTQAMKSKVIW